MIRKKKIILTLRITKKIYILKIYEKFFYLYAANC